MFYPHSFRERGRKKERETETDKSLKVRKCVCLCVGERAFAELLHLKFRRFSNETMVE